MLFRSLISFSACLSFALIMKARHYNRRLFREIEREHLGLNVCSIQESNSIGKEAIDYFCEHTTMDSEQLRNDVEYLIEVFNDAKEYGSILEVNNVNFDALRQRLFCRIILGISLSEYPAVLYIS